MSEPLFTIFGDSLTKQAIRNVGRQPLSTVGNENMGKMVSAGPLKPNEPVKKMGEAKKSFLSNTGKALQGTTPMRKAFTPRAVNVGSMIYTDEEEDSNKNINIEELQFTKSSFKLDNYHRDILDYLPQPPIPEETSPPNTPPPAVQHHSTELDCSYQDEFFTDDFSMNSFSEDDLPQLY